MTSGNAALLVLLLLVVFAVIVIVRTVKIVPQQVSLIIERLGKFSRTLEGGLHFLVPFVVPNVDWRAHVGGLLAGLIAGVVDHGCADAGA